jgi:peroxiredoxin
MWGRKTKVMPAVGVLAPEFELASLAGGSRSLHQILSSGPALLAFFKISCPVCQLTFPFLERLAANSAFQVIGISQDDAGDTESFMRRFGVTFPVLLDQSKDGYPVSNGYGISSVPSMFLVERDGRISGAFNGFSKRDLEDLGARAAVAPFRPGEQVPEWKAG